MRLKSAFLSNPLAVWLSWISSSLLLKIRNRGNSLKIGYMAVIDRTTFGRFNTIYPNASLTEVTIGDMSYVGRSTRVRNTSIGKFTCIGPECLIGLGRHPTDTFVSSHPAFYSTLGQSQIFFVSEQLFEEFRPITIGNDVWIGARAIVLDGVKIGDGAIIAAGSIVNKDVAPYEIAGGVPAKTIGYRFSQEHIRDLLRFEWWNMGFEWLRMNAGEFADIEKMTALITAIEMSRPAG